MSSLPPHSHAGAATQALRHLSDGQAGLCQARTARRPQLVDQRATGRRRQDHHKGE
ncbi:hypothetical protein KWH03_11740 [Xanthomonas campestris pv. lawsoniae]|nr:hypothetical protein [Xanthomonas campestris pv. lawsoniae]